MMCRDMLHEASVLPLNVVVIRLGSSAIDFKEFRVQFCKYMFTWKMIVSKRKSIE